VSRSPQILNQGTDTANGHAAWVTAYNTALKTMVDEFIASNTGVCCLFCLRSCCSAWLTQLQTTTVLYDTWTFMTKVLDAPVTYGFSDATCVNDDGVSCVWWNDYHPGYKYHKLQAADMKLHMQSLGAW
jgi:hypothetical protein